MTKIQKHIQSNRNLIFFLLLQIFLSTLIHGQTETFEEAIPKVYLNHSFLVIDSATYKDIVESDFIKNEFATFEVRTTISDNNESWTEAYIYGEKRYLEKNLD